MDMSITVGWNAAVSAGVTREEMDAWAFRSHQRAVAAIDDGRFEDEIVPIEVRRRDGSTVTFAADEHPRRDTTLDKLASLKPLHPEIEGFSITAGNAAGVNDGAAAMVLADGTLAGELGLQPLAVVRAWASAGVRRQTPGWRRPSPSRRPSSGPVSASGTSICGDQRGLRLDVRGHHQDPGDRRLHRERARERLQPGPSDRHDRRPDGHLAGHELGRRGGGTAVAAMCAGGGMSTALVLDVAPATSA